MGALESLRSSLNRIQRQMDDRKRKNNAIQAEVDRLQKVYNELKKLKNDKAKPLRNDANKNRCIGTVAWRGDNKKFFDLKMDYLVKEEAKNFENRIDDMLDRINTIKTKKQNEKKSGLGILDGLKSQYRNVKTKIENFVN